MAPMSQSPQCILSPKFCCLMSDSTMINRAVILSLPHFISHPRSLHSPRESDRVRALFQCI
ncbi:hypothetical protein BYT27DRAFT_7122327 [Phlegmacium glaucopus]|nr:hypothetical protein BYT27DRAFT_7122327 [Phlegmacium glaucopus]